MSDLEQRIRKLAARAEAIADVLEKVRRHRSKGSGGRKGFGSHRGFRGKSHRGHGGSRRGRRAYGGNAEGVVAALSSLF